VGVRFYRDGPVVAGSWGSKASLPARRGAAQPAKVEAPQADRSGYNREPFLFSAYLPVRLSELLPGNTALVREVEDVGSADPIARRLRDLGFVAGEPVRLVTRGPVGADPVLVQIGFTRFALRRSEAARVWLQLEGAGA
jgi:ferrous iron transport protein A